MSFASLQSSQSSKSSKSSQSSSSLCNSWLNEGHEWTAKIFTYIYEDDDDDGEIVSRLTNNKEKILHTLHSLKNWDIVGVEIFASEIPNATSFIRGLEFFAYATGGAVALPGLGSVVLSKLISQPSNEIMEEEIPNWFTYFYAKREAKANKWIHHDFVIMTIRCVDDSIKFCSLEKFNTGLVLQISGSKQKLLSTVVGDDRRDNGKKKVFQVPLETDSSQPFKLKDLVDWIFENKELDKKYVGLPAAMGGDHCQHFAERVFNHVAVKKKYPTAEKTEDKIFESLMKELTKEKDK